VGEIAYAHTIKIRALAKLGELFSSLPEVKGGRPCQIRSTSDEPPTLAAVVSMVAGTRVHATAPVLHL